MQNKFGKLSITKRKGLKVIKNKIKEDNNKGFYLKVEALESLLCQLYNFSIPFFQVLNYFELLIYGVLMNECNHNLSSLHRQYNCWDYKRFIGYPCLFLPQLGFYVHMYILTTSWNNISTHSLIPLSYGIKSQYMCWYFVIAKSYYDFVEIHCDLCRND